MKFFWISSAVAYLLGAALCYTISGTHGLFGFLLGLGATGYDIVALWFLIRLWGKWELGQIRPSIGSLGAVVAFFGKLPVFILMGNVAHSLGEASSNCFLAGLALVYFSLVGWALVQK